jgi:hydroxymethylpyrimidine pyrophosphatase-like HAD family hydrolase
MMSAARKYLALASDGDGTLTRGGHMGKATLDALRRLRASGRKVILTTGESRDDLESFPHLELFDLIVAENGAVLHEPTTAEEWPLAGPPPVSLLRALTGEGIEPLKAGCVIISTETSRRRKVEDVLAKLGIERELITNRHRLMLLPPGVNKATGLAAALKRLGLSPCHVVSVGDAENDLPLIGLCGVGVAVGNAVPALKARANLVTKGGPGRGVVELIDHILRDDLVTAPEGKTG